MVHPNTKRVQYTGELLAIAKAVQGAAAGGQVLASGDTMGQMSTGEEAEADGMEPLVGVEMAHMVHLGQHHLAVLLAQPPLGSEEVALDVKDSDLDKDRESGKQTWPSMVGIMSEGEQSSVSLKNSHEIVMMIPGPLRERELHFPTIKTDLQVRSSGRLRFKWFNYRTTPQPN